MVDKQGVNNGAHELKLGKSFTNDSSSFHTFRYDFKPASIDKTKVGEVEMGYNNSATVTLPHTDGSGQTVYKGNKRPTQKECVLIIDHQTGEITLEKISSATQLKKTRSEGPKPTNLSRPSTPVDKNRPPSRTDQHPVSKPEHVPAQPSMPAVPASPKDVDSMSGSSSDSDSSSSSDDEEDSKPAPATASLQKTSSQNSSSQPGYRKRTTSLLRDDLNLSESGSDSE